METISTGTLNFIANSGTLGVILVGIAWVARQVWPELRDWMRSQAALNRAAIQTLQNISNDMDDTKAKVDAIHVGVDVLLDRIGGPGRQRQVGKREP